MSKSPVKALDRALNDPRTPSDDELAELVEIGTQLQGVYRGFTPPHGPQRAMFVGAVTQRARGSWLRFVAPATVTAALLIGVVLLGRSALPGGTFYPVREVLRTVGLAPASVQEVEAWIAQADDMLDQAERIQTTNQNAAERIAFEAVKVIGMAEGALDELEVGERAAIAADLAELSARAEAILTDEPRAQKKSKNAFGTRTAPGLRGANGRGRPDQPGQSNATPGTAGARRVDGRQRSAEKRSTRADATDGQTDADEQHRQDAEHRGQGRDTAQEKKAKIERTDGGLDETTDIQKPNLPDVKGGGSPKG